MRFVQAHGMDAGPLQRPLAAGALTGFAATAPAAAVLVAFGSFGVAADRVMRLSRPIAGLLLVAAFTVAGAGYGLAFRRAANDRRGGWLFGAAYGFVLWMAAPIVVLPLLSDHAMAAGRPASGFFAAFLVWGAVLGGLFPYVHRPLHGELDARREPSKRLGPVGAAVGKGVRHPPGRAGAAAKAGPGAAPKNAPKDAPKDAK